MAIVNSLGYEAIIPGPAGGCLQLRSQAMRTAGLDQGQLAIRIRRGACVVVDVDGCIDRRIR